MIKKIRHIVSLLIRDDNPYSIKSFSLILGSVAGFIVAIAIAIALIIDASYDGSISSDIEGVAWILLGVSVLITGGNIVKVFRDRYTQKQKGDKDV